jgi:hypothetical protein
MYRFPSDLTVRSNVSQIASEQTLDGQPSSSVVKVDPTFPVGFPGPPSKLPLKTTGKLFMIFANGQRATCSGNVVTSLNGSVVNTAAHCLYNTQSGSLAESVIFCPQYNAGDCPVGKWVAKSLIVNPAYKINGNPREDFGMIVVFPKKGKTLVETVGGDGWMYNGLRLTEEKPFGYPSNVLQGQRLITCPTTLGESFLGSVQLSKLPKCNMGSGSSGGPWYISVNGLLYVNGHNDIGPLDSSFIVSPYYGSKWFANFDRAQRIPV